MNSAKRTPTGRRSPDAQCVRGRLCSDAACVTGQAFQPVTTAQQRFCVVHHRGTIEQMLMRLHRLLDEQGPTWRSGYSTPRLFVQPAPHQVQGRKRPEEPQAPALGRSRGGLVTKIHMLCGCPRKCWRWMLADKVHDAEAYAALRSLSDAVGNPAAPLTAQTVAGLAII